MKIAGALETAHRLGTLHRDIKPANILLTEYGEPQLADFGIARIAGGFETATGVVTGSPAFTAPEVLLGRSPTPASDVYSLGATLFCALTGHAAFERRSGERVVAQFLRVAAEPTDGTGSGSDTRRCQRRHRTRDGEQSRRSADDGGRLWEQVAAHPKSPRSDRRRHGRASRWSTVAVRRSPSPVQIPKAPASRVRVVLAEDDLLLREGLASLLERSGFDVVGQAGDGAQLLAIVRETTPDLVVTDIRMPPANFTEGLDAARVIREELPHTAVVVLSAHVDVEHAMELLAGGRSIGYLLKSRVTDVADFIDTLQRVTKGASVVDPALVQELVSARRRDDPLAVPQRARTGGAGADGGGSVECRYRSSALGHRRHGGKARAQHPDQAQPARDRRRPSPGPGGDHLPGGALIRAGIGSPQTLRFSDLIIHACFSSESMISCRRSLVLGSTASTASWTARMVLTAP